MLFVKIRKIGTHTTKSIKCVSIEPSNENGNCFRFNLADGVYLDFSEDEWEMVNMVLL